MSGATIQTFADHGEPLDLSASIHKLLRNNSGWEGTASELAEQLNCSLTPRALSAHLHRRETADALKGAGVSVKFSRSHGVRSIILSKMAETTHAATTACSEGKHTGAAKTIALSESEIRFPFAWEYATIAELSEQQKAEANRPLGNGRTRHYRHCSTCGAGGADVIQFVKVSNSYRSYHCRACMVDYVRKARKIMVSWGH